MEFFNGEAMAVCINDALTDDELRAVFARLDLERERDSFGLVCRRWLRIQSSERRRLRARAGPVMLQRLAARFSGLQELDLSQSTSRSFFPGVTDQDLGVIAAGFTNLHSLSLQHCTGITDEGLVRLGQGLASLQALDVSNCTKLGDRGVVSAASGCGDLRRLRLTGCRLITDSSLRALSRHCSMLEELVFAGCFNITDSGLVALSAGCRHLKLLDVSKCSKIGDPGIGKIVEVASASLISLRMSDCNKVGDPSILAVAKFCRNLETLVISGCRDVTDESIRVLAAGCGESLRSLCMDWCVNITDASLRCLLQNCLLLVALDIGCCDKVTDAGFQTLRSASQLKVLKANNCSRLTVLSARLVFQFCTALEYFDLRSCPGVTRQVIEQAGVYIPETCKMNFSGALTESSVFAGFF